MKTTVPAVTRWFASFNLVALLFASGFTAHAGNVYWDNGGGDSLWTTAANWSSNPDNPGGSYSDTVTVGTGDTAYFNVSTLNSPQLVSYSAIFTIGGFVFTNTSTTSFTNTSGGGKAITLGSGGLTINSGAGTVSFVAPTVATRINFTLGAPQTWQNNSANTFALTTQNLIALGANVLTIDGSGSITAGSAISSTTAGNGLTKNGSGTLTLSALNTFTGPLTINSGTVTATTFSNLNANSSSIGKGTGAASDLVFGGGILQHTEGNPRTTDRLFTIGNANGLTATIDSSATTATDTLSFVGTGALLYGGSGARTLTLTGSTTGTNTFAPVIGDGTGGATSLVKSGAGTWILKGNNTYTGGTTNNAGQLNINSSTAIGATASTLTLGGGNLDNTSGGLITLANNNAMNWNSNFTFVGTSDLNLGTGAVTLGGIMQQLTVTAGNLYVGGPIGGAAPLSFRKPGSGTLWLTNTASTYNNTNYVDGGTLVISKLANVGQASSLGQPADSASGQINLGISTTPATLIYIGAGDTSDRILRLNGTTGGVTLQADGTGPLVLTSSMPAGGGSKTLTLQGSNAGNNTIGGAIQNNTTANKTAVTKTGTGKWVLGGTNTYTGNTTISQGTLALGANGSIATTPIITVAGSAILDVSAASFSVAGAQVLQGSGSVNGNAAASANSGILPGGNGTAGTLTFNNNLTLNDGSALAFDLTSNPAGVNDQILVAGNVVNNGNTIVVLKGLDAGVLGAGNYILMTNASRSGTGTFVLDQTYTNVSLFKTSTNLQLVVGTGGGLTSKTWIGGTVVSLLTTNVWDINNSPVWTYSGGVSNAVYNDGDAVTFDDSTANTTVNLGTAVSPASVTVNSVQNYTVSGSGSINGTGSLTKFGTGSLTLSNLNSFSGGVTLNSGTLIINTNIGALGAGTFTINGGALSSVLNSAVNVTNPMVINADFINSGNGGGQNMILGNSNAPITLGTAAGTSRTISVTGSGAMEIDGNIVNGTTANKFILDVTGAGSLVNVYGTNTFTGGLVIKHGNVALGNIGTTAGGQTYAAGTGVITLGDSAGAPGTDAFVGVGSYTLTNDINLVATATTKCVIGEGGATRSSKYTGNVSLNGHDLYLDTRRAISGGVFMGGNISGIGSLTLTNGGAGSTNAIIVITNALNITGNITNMGTGATNIIYGNIPSTVGTVAVIGGSALLLGGSNSYTGDTILAATAMLIVSNGASLGGAGNIFIPQNSALIVKQTSTISKNITFGTGGVTEQINPDAGTVLTLTGHLTGNNVAATHNTGGTIILTSSNYFSGGSMFFLGQLNGTLALSNAYALNGAELKFNASNLSVDNITGSPLTLQNFNGVDMTSGFFFLGSSDMDLSGGQSGFIQTANSLRTITVNAKTLTMSGILASGTSAFGTVRLDGRLNKAGSGRLILNGNSDYTGVTTNLAGTLLVNGSMASSAVYVMSGATNGGTGSFSGPVTYNAGSHALFTQGSPMAFNGGLTLSSSPTLHVNLGNGVTAGSYTLATSGSAISGTFADGLVIDSGTFASGTTTNVFYTNNAVTLVVSGGGGGGAVATTTTLGTSGSPSTYGDSVTFTAIVKTNTVLAGNATSNYVFKVDGTAVATNTMSGGQATYSTTNLIAGVHSIAAEYAGDANYLPSTNTVSQSVNPKGLTVTANNTNLVYTGVAFSGGNGVTYAGFVNGETNTALGGVLSYSGTSQGAIAVGSYVITPSGLTNLVNTNYTIGFANGTLTINHLSTTTNVTSSVTGNTLTLTWPDSHLGWMAQSNAVDLANPGDWYDINDSTNGTSLSIPMDAAQTNVFYRLRLP